MTIGFDQLTGNKLAGNTNRSATNWPAAQTNRQQIGRQHKSSLKFIEALRKLQDINKNKIETLCAQGPPTERRKYNDLDARLKTIVEDFANLDMLDFLGGIAHNIEIMQ